jgi:hypothetical protein
MKRHFSSVAFGCVGLCVGFLLCYVYLALPERTAAAKRPQWVAVSAQGQDTLDWRPYVIQPMIPPKIVGREGNR